MCVLLIAAAAMTAGCSQRHNRLQPMSADGLFDDWEAMPVVATDPAGDATGAYDVVAIQATNRGSVLWVALELTDTLNLQNGPEGMGTLQILVDTPRTGTLVIDMRNRRAWTQEAPGITIPWSTIDYVSSPTYANARFEMQIDLAAMGVGRGDRVRIQCDGSDTLARPITVHMSHAPQPMRAVVPSRQHDTDFRVACYNTLHEGLTDPHRSMALQRILTTANADVFCLQEQWDTTPKELAEVMAQLTDTDDDQWYTIKGGGTMIATRLPATKLPLEANFGSAVGVTLPGGQKVVVICVHFKAMGYIGNEDDQKRIEQAHQVDDFVASLGNGQLGRGFEEYRDAGVIITGDYNLVGSRTPLDTLLDIDSRPLQIRQLRHLGSWRAYTWRDDSASFVPGRLDWMIYTPDRLTAGQGFIIDTSRLHSSDLRTLGLHRQDSQASDHLPLVADFEVHTHP